MKRSIVLNISLLGASVGCSLAPHQLSAAQCAEPNAQAQVIHAVVPAYPQKAAPGAEGDVTVRITIGANGSVTAASVLKSSGSAALDTAAIAAAKASTYTPKIVNCQPVPSTYAFHVMFAANGPNVPLTPIHVVPGLIGYARLGIETTRVLQLLDNQVELAEPEAQRYIDQVQHDLIALMPEKQTEISELRKNLVVTPTFNSATAHSAWGTVMLLATSHFQRGSAAARSFGIGTAAAQTIHNAETTQDLRSDALFRGVIASETVLDADVPHLKDLRDAVHSAAAADWKAIDLSARAVVRALIGEST